MLQPKIKSLLSNLYSWNNIAYHKSYNMDRQSPKECEVFNTLYVHISLEHTLLIVQ